MEKQAISWAFCGCHWVCPSGGINLSAWVETATALKSARIERYVVPEPVGRSPGRLHCANWAQCPILTGGTIPRGPPSVPQDTWTACVSSSVVRSGSHSSPSLHCCLALTRGPAPSPGQRRMVRRAALGPVHFLSSSSSMRQSCQVQLPEYSQTSASPSHPLSPGFSSRPPSWPPASTSPLWSPEQS